MVTPLTFLVINFSSFKCILRNFHNSSTPHLKRLYVPDPNEREKPYASPLGAPDVSGLPPALIITAELDPQRDEGEAYAQRLRDAGCLVTHTRYPGVLHGFFQMGGVITSGRVAIAEVAHYLRFRFSLVS